MDKNTITGIALIFLIFLGFSLYNSQKSKKAFEAETEYADSLYSAGSYDQARESYIRALNLRPKDQTTVNRVIELNNKLGQSAQPQQPEITQAGGDTTAARAQVQATADS